MRGGLAGLALMLLAVPLLAGCTSWPPAGQGGLAEAMPLPPPAAQEAPALRRRLDCDLARFDRLAGLAEAQGRLSGRIELARRTAARAKREYLGGLPGDAMASLDQLGTEAGAIRLALGTLPSNAQPMMAQPMTECR